MEFVSHIQQKLHVMAELAKELDGKAKQKANNRKARHSSLEVVGELVLVLPDDTCKLIAHSGMDRTRLYRRSPLSYMRCERRHTIVSS